MKRIRLVIQYDGTAYVGWQTQPNGLAVQERIEREPKKLTGAPTVLHASGRTDSGVHALAQVAHFDTASRIPPDKFAYALNAGLPADIRILFSGEAEEWFHARFDVVKKHYRYNVQHSPHANAFTRTTALHVHTALDMDAMNVAAGFLLGTHDFSAFHAAGRPVESAVRTIYRSEWTKEGCLLHYDVAGSGFLYNMVRILVGTMLEIGQGRRAVESIPCALASGDRRDAGPTAPAHGLMLRRVEYSDFDTEDYLC